jgi:lipopolysaccharide biosynthesis glycosyltransferase
MSTGVVYVASGESFIDEACQSVSSLKHKMPNIHTTIFSSQSIQCKFFDEVVLIKSSQNKKLDKLIYMSKSPYDKTIFLDTDTYVDGDFSELFTLLEKYDIGAAEAELRAGRNRLGESYNYQDIKDIDGRFVYPMYNSGVIVYRKSPQVSQFFSDWLTLAEKQMQEKGIGYGDQPSFQIILHKSNLRQIVLTPEYNCRFTFPVCVSGIVKILHGRHPDLQTVAKEINSGISTRLFHPRWGLISDKKLQLITKVLAK